MNGLKTFRWWWGWDCERAEQWLEEMEFNGYKLDHVTMAGVRFHFEKTTASKKVRYCIDYQPKLDSKYISLIHDDGWELIPMGVGWYVCRKEYENRRPDLYTDYESLLIRNRKLLAIVVAVSIPMFAVTPSVLRNFSPNGASMTITGIWIMLCLFYVYAAANLLSVNKLIKKKKELKDY